MSTISRIREQIEAARSRLQAMPHGDALSFSQSLSQASLVHHVRELEKELRLSLEARRVEVLTLRLDGPGLRNGSIRLGLLARVGDHVAAAIQAGVQRRRTGRRVARLSPKIQDLLDLRLAGIGAGSTTLQITGSTSPDLFGESDLETVLDETFDVLGAIGREALAEAVAAVGVRTAREVSQLARVLAAETASLEATWRAPSDEVRVWSGSPVDLAKLAESLSSFEEREPEDVPFVGTVMTLSARGKFEVDLGGRVLAGTFPSALQDTIRLLRIGDEVTGVVRRTTVVNVATDRTRMEHALLTIQPSGQGRFGER